MDYCCSHKRMYLGGFTPKCKGINTNVYSAQQVAVYFLASMVLF